MKRIGFHIHFYCAFFVLIAAVVMTNIGTSEARCFYLMVVLTVFALIQGQIKNTIMMWACFLFAVGLLFMFRHYGWSDDVISRYTFVTMRDAMPPFYALYIFGSKPVSEITAGFDSLHFPKRTGIAIVTLFRYFPTLGHDVKTAHENMKMRGLSGVGNFVRHPARTVRCFVLPLIVHLYSTVEELSVSATARGVESNRKRHSLYGKKFAAIDGIVLVGTLAGLFCVLWV